MTGDRIGPAQVAVLLDPFARAVKVPMPVLLGEWVPSAGVGRWLFRLSVVGVEVAERARALSEGADDALQRHDLACRETEDAVFAYRERCAPEPSDAPTFTCEGLKCPECGAESLFGYMLRDDDGQHMHTRYVCTRWESGAESRCGWSGWAVPGWRDQPAGREPTPSSEPRDRSGLRNVVVQVIRDLHAIAPGKAEQLQAALDEDAARPRVDVEAAMLCAEAYGADRECPECRRVVEALLAGEESGELLVCVKHYAPTPSVDVEALRAIADSLYAPGTHQDAHAIREAIGDTPGSPPAEDDLWKPATDEDIDAMFPQEPSGVPAGPGWPMKPRTKDDLERWGEHWWLGEGENRRAAEVRDQGGRLVYSDTRGTANWLVDHTDDPWGGPCIQGSADKDWGAQVAELAAELAAECDAKDAVQARGDALTREVESLIRQSRESTSATDFEVLAQLRIQLGNAVHAAKRQAPTGESP